MYCRTLFLFLCLLSLAMEVPAQVPKKLGGFELGKNFNVCRGLVRSDTEMPLRYLESMKEVEIQPIAGFKSGLIYYSTCATDGKVVRIRFKYLDSSKRFFQELLTRIKKRFGEPDYWQGDPFGTVLTWKWSFLDEENNSISMVVQHNTKDPDQKMGNSIKMTLTNLFEAERDCFLKQQDESEVKMRKKHVMQGRYTDEEWEIFVPRS